MPASHPPGQQSCGSICKAIGKHEEAPVAAIQVSHFRIHRAKSRSTSAKNCRILSMSVTATHSPTPSSPRRLPGAGERPQPRLLPPCLEQRARRRNATSQPAGRGAALRGVASGALQGGLGVVAAAREPAPRHGDPEVVLHRGREPPRGPVALQGWEEPEAIVPHLGCQPPRVNRARSARLMAYSAVGNT